MLNRGFLYGALFAFVHLAAACSAPSGETDATPVEKAEKAEDPAPVAIEDADPLILAFGDSLYAGYGVKQTESFPARLQAVLNRGGGTAYVHNAGVSGDTTAAGLQRLAFTLDGLPKKPDLALLGLGGNDMLRGIQPDETRANLKAMLDEFKARGIPVVLTGMLAAPNLGPDYAAAFNRIYPDLAKEYDAALYPFLLDGVVTDAALMQGDRIHPTAEGLESIAERVAPVVEPLVEKTP